MNLIVKSKKYFKISNNSIYSGLIWLFFVNYLIGQSITFIFMEMTQTVDQKIKELSDKNKEIQADKSSNIKAE